MIKFDLSRYNFSDIGNRPPTFKEIIQAAKRTPSPLQELIATISEITERAPETIRMWEYDVQLPSPDRIERLVEFTGIPAEVLFPKLKTKSNQS